jgi:aspartyl-tRNA(Asn)/glutamyl-tRNA(Gln) amidotransferase subunit C
MKIDVDHVAKLARLGLTEEEKKLFGGQLSSILDYAAILQKLDTTNVLPTSHAIPMENVLREDKVIPCQNVKPILANGPEVTDHMFKVPKIIE